MLEPLGKTTTRVNWCRRFIATDDQGRAWIARLTPEAMAAATDKLRQLLAHDLATGGILRK